jgi:Lactate racemase N-terminal domain
MAQTQEFTVSCGAGKIPAKLPADRLRLPPGPPPSAEKLVSKNAKVTIGIQDGRANDYLPEDQDLRILGLPILLELLEHYGVRPENIQIKVANALHRMWTRKEMVHILGPRLPYTLGGRLSCIDATDKISLSRLA